MALVLPFRALRPRREYAAQVAALPYDVMTREEGKQAVEGKPLSFLRVEKSEIDVPDATRPDDLIIYETAKRNLARLRDEGILQQDSSPCYYIYRQQMGAQVQTGIVGVMSALEYDEGKIKKHELTRQDKEDDRTRHVDYVNAQTGPVFISYSARSGINEIVQEVAAGEPEYDFTAEDSVRHTAWLLTDQVQIETVKSEFAKVSTLYIADGHHRAAAGAAVARKRRKEGGPRESDMILAVFFPHDQLKVMDYNRAVKDLRGLTPEEFKEKISNRFSVSDNFAARSPERPHDFGMYLSGRWYRITIKEGVYDAADPVASLDAAILQEHLLAPVLGIDNPRTDERIKFIGGIRGMSELEKLVDQEGYAVAFSLYATSMQEIMKVADAGAIMPPKSTWFEPKLRSGLFVHCLEQGR
ncbi:MAG: DUF1015 domain-containing protein [Smithella sp.]|jgi:uncharacterized protein (DUF1015 family)|nr:DUF1015 domain-containing protein [Smithella sp.]